MSTKSTEINPALTVRAGRFLAAADREMAEVVRCYEATLAPDANAHTDGGQLLAMYAAEKELVEHVKLATEYLYGWADWSGLYPHRGVAEALGEQLLNRYVEAYGGTSQLYREVPFGERWAVIRDRAAVCPKVYPAVERREQRLLQLQRDFRQLPGRRSKEGLASIYECSGSEPVRYLVEVYPPDFTG